MTSRACDRLLRVDQSNIALRVEYTERGGVFKVSAAASSIWES